ncbi:hypothetical protein ISS30_05200 [bacterium]|nr:hypothetical protein [bacterium]
MKKFVVFFLVLLLSLQVLGQYRENTPSTPVRSRFTVPAQSNIFGLFNPQNLQMSHSYSFMVATSNSGSLMQGLYLNSMRYRISDPLTMNVRLGILHQPYSSYTGYTPQAANFLGGVELEYHPTNNIGLYLGFSNMPIYYSPYLYDNRYSRYTPQVIDKE